MNMERKRGRVGLSVLVAACLAIVKRKRVRRW